MKKLPQGIWKDTVLNKRLAVLYYDSRERSYRAEYLDDGGVRVWLPVEEFNAGERYQSLGVWGRLLRQKVDLQRGRPVLMAGDAILSN
jgi:hypothetical protein